MSITREEATVQIYGLKKYCEDMADSDESGSYVFDLDVQALDLALTALRPVSRERIKQAWRGEWIIQERKHSEFIKKCSKCGFPISGWWGADKFCANCGAPMTDEAVEITMRRLEALNEED